MLITSFLLLLFIDIFFDLFSRKFIPWPFIGSFNWQLDNINIKDKNIKTLKCLTLNIKNMILFITI